jgi:hypothetical protein
MQLTAILADSYVRKVIERSQSSLAHPSDIAISYSNWNVVTYF